MEARGKNFRAMGEPEAGNDSDTGLLWSQPHSERWPPLTLLPVHCQHDFTVRAFAQDLQHLEVLRRVHGRQGLSRQVAHLIQELSGSLDTRDSVKEGTSYTSHHISYV